MIYEREKVNYTSKNNALHSWNKGDNWIELDIDLVQ
jgi:hypothetical protein